MSIPSIKKQNKSVAEVEPLFPHHRVQDICPAALQVGLLSSYVSHRFDTHSNYTFSATSTRHEQVVDSQIWSKGSHRACRPGVGTSWWGMLHASMTPPLMSREPWSCLCLYVFMALDSIPNVCKTATLYGSPPRLIHSTAFHLNLVNRLEFKAKWLLTNRPVHGNVHFVLQEMRTSQSSGGSILAVYGSAGGEVCFCKVNIHSQWAAGCSKAIVLGCRGFLSLPWMTPLQVGCTLLTNVTGKTNVTCTTNLLAY